MLQLIWIMEVNNKKTRQTFHLLYLLHCIPKKRNRSGLLPCDSKSTWCITVMIVADVYFPSLMIIIEICFWLINDSYDFNSTKILTIKTLLQKLLR